VAEDQAQSGPTALRAALGQNGQIGLELGRAYIHTGSPGDWYTPGMEEIDVFLEDMVQPIVQNLDGTQQLATRVLGPAATNIAPANAGPYYFSGPRPRGPITVVAFESCAYDVAHATIDAAGVKQANDALYNVGYRFFANGQPTGH
jgi:hypothetical protein